MMLKNLRLKANSTNPSVTLTVFYQPPDLGTLDKSEGKKANKEKGKANAIEKPNIPTIGLVKEPPADSTKIVPTIGPVHENETKTRVNAIKNVPIKPPSRDLEFTLFTHEFGSIISKAPRNEKAKIKKTIKNIKLGIQCVLKKLARVGPNNCDINTPRTV